MKRYQIIILSVLTFLAALFVGSWWRDKSSQFIPPLASSTPSASSPTVSSSVNPTSSPTTTATPKPSPLPDKVLIDVPFTVQAPLANWDQLHEEACEEASLLMVYHFLKGTNFGSPNNVETEIQDLVKWETDHGYAQDVTIAQLKEIASTDFKLTTGRAVTDATVTKIKQELAAGRPVIIPASGRDLPNPYFTAPGPVYHMLVVTGYDSNGFITNDPGTKRGEGFRYTFDALYNAIHDWNSTDIHQGGKTYLVFD